MQSVLIPQQQSTVKTNQAAKSNTDALKIVGGVAGAVVGGMAAGPGGAAAGAMAGGAGGMSLGGAVSPYLFGSESTEVPGGPQGMAVSSNTDSAMQRRMAMQQQDPYQGLVAANMALQNAPKYLQDEYRKPLGEALDIASRNRQTDTTYA